MTAERLRGDPFQSHARGIQRRRLVTSRRVRWVSLSGRAGGAEPIGAATWLQITGSPKDHTLCQTEPSQI